MLSNCLAQVAWLDVAACGSVIIGLSTLAAAFEYWLKGLDFDFDFETSVDRSLTDETSAATTDVTTQRRID